MLYVKNEGKRARIPPYVAMSVMHQIVTEVFAEAGFDAGITSGLDGNHSETSDHYKGIALDWRTRDMSQGIKRQVLKELKKRLGPDYYFKQHKTHLHISWRPKGGYNL